MWILGVETSGAGGEIALLRDDEVLAEQPLAQAGRRHAQTLISEVDQVLRRFGLKPRECDAVAVSHGPGSFTGLRVGIVFAKTLAYATGCRLAAVETFAAIAANSPSDVSEVWVIEDAQRGDLFVGRYRREPNSQWRNTSAVSIVPAEEWLATRTAEDVLTGPGLRKLPRQPAPPARILDQEVWFPRAATIARLGRSQIEAGQVDDPWSLRPFYLRKSAAEEKWDALRQPRVSQQ